MKPKASYSLTFALDKHQAFVTLVRTWGDATSQTVFLDCTLHFLRYTFSFFVSLLSNLFTQGLQVAAFYDLWLLSYDLLLKVMSRPI